MESYARMQLARDPAWRILLTAYAEAQVSGPPAEFPKSDESPAAEADDDFEARDESEDEPSSVTWVARMDLVEGVDEEDLPRLHGRLIAFGLLKFQLASAAVGVEYRVTPLGTRMLAECEEPGCEETGDESVLPAA